MKIDPPYLKFIVFSGGGGLVIREQDIKLGIGENVIEVQNVPSSFDEDTVAVELIETEAELIEIVVKKPDKRFVEDTLSRERLASEKILSESVDLRTEIREELLSLCEGVQARRYEDSSSEFVVIVDSKKEEDTAKINISYFIGDPRVWWTPTLQIDLDESNNARMTGYILVENQTNLAFKDINLEFAEFEGVRKWQEPGEYGVQTTETAVWQSQPPNVPPPPGSPQVQRSTGMPQLRGEMLKELRRLKKIK
ncbi:MAG: hypothetical protein ACFFD4_01480 [Candidatus Odinarchaeota archaeon]